MTEFKLKPCPFCGGEAYFKIATTGHICETRSIHFRIECRKCGISRGRGEVFYRADDNLNMIVTYDDRQKAVDEWNERG